MKHSQKKKSLLALALSLAPTATTLLVKGQTIEGGILLGMSVVMVIAYDHYDDKAKQPSLPSGIDAETFEELASLGAEGINQFRQTLDEELESNDE